ncbi:hypothetical protein NE857_04795 [Nocardiopsis exhalans]|uniref:Uncharacterized protein n=1 Tax=Nocardiopsis exhalans TaxID=163604 RepID=A0ABY5D9D8_9ACTN|nr:hypothetical protein [Nocardiopsis exhalans]USY20969.1 hypothetical protein NE857_04795 [Nocardiopsis exhalans]
MIPRTSRTGALRAASAACAAAPSLLALPLLVGAFLAVSWLLAAPAQADAGSGTLGGPVAETASAAGGALGLGETPTLEKQTLERVVPEEITEPVTATLGTVHQRLEKGTADTAAVAATLHEPAAEVRDEVRGVVTEIDRARGETVERGLAHTLPTTDPRTTEPRTSRTTGPQEDEGTAGSGDEERDSSSESTDGSTEATSPTTPGAPVRQPATAQQHRSESAAETTRAATAGTGAADRAPEPQRFQAATGSAAPAAGAPAPAGGVAGYLTAAPLPAPAADTVRLAAHRLHTVPADPADDPTVSPD